MATARKHARAPAKVRRRKGFAIDVHAHIRVPEVLEFVRRNPVKARGAGTEDWFGGNSVADLRNRDRANWEKLTDPRMRLEVMDGMGIDIQAISSNLPVTCYWADGRTGLRVARALNDGIAEFVAADPDRFVGIGSVPMQAPKLAAKELERVVTELGFRAAWIASNIRGQELGAQKFRPFWAKAEELGVPVFVHPLGFTDTSRLQDYFMWNSVGQPLEELLAMSSLIYEGVMDEFPGLKVVICHGGGYLPYYAGRADHAWRVHPDRRGGSSKPPSAYLRRFHYDNIVFNTDMQEFLARKAGSNRILMGTDYPHGERDPVGFVRRTRGLSAEARDDILWKNAARLLRISV